MAKIVDWLHTKRKSTQRGTQPLPSTEILYSGWTPSIFATEKARKVREWDANGVYCVFLVEMRVDRLGYEVFNQTQDVQSTVAVAAAACDWPIYEVDQSDTSCIEHCCRCTGGM